ncbi:GntR family transcriptional regulator [Aquabacter sp. CN5-332]|uniref:GntR family transcriptional regulator n=1 Tax=Aquabacter sp. CN5-332 TaxID=3156608 RepID=UPI0032B4AD9D
MAAGRSTKLIEDIADRIRSKIVSGKYAPGERLKQETLAEEFAVSRTPIREALSRLEAQGLVAQEQRRSAIVCAPSSRDVAEMYQIRAEMEGLAAHLAARWITDSGLARLRASHERFISSVTTVRAGRNGALKGKAAEKSRAQAHATWTTMNAEFHNIIAAASNNRNLERLLADMRFGYTGAVMTNSIFAMDITRLEANLRHHATILAALEKRDAVKARRAMIDHVTEAGEFVVAWFENQAIA